MPPFEVLDSSVLFPSYRYLKRCTNRTLSKYTRPEIVGPENAHFKNGRETIAALGTPHLKIDLMGPQDLSPNINEDIIGSATSIDEIIAALAKRGCINLTSSINLAACSEFPCAGGGFCDVYRGELRDGTKIAIKSLRVYDGPNGDSQRRKILKHAARELYHWSKLRHSNVLPLMGLMLFRDHISMVSEWMDNGSLISFLRVNPHVNKIQLCMNICDGLCYIHANKMVHGDLKAANVMISRRGVAMIADFGNAQLKDLTLRFSNTGNNSFSVRWAAPELLTEDDGSQASKQADVYAYGMTVLEVMTGKIPFEGTPERRVVYLVAVEQKHPPRPDVGLDDDLWEVLNLCWTPSPLQRPSITDVSDHLQTMYPEDSLEGLDNILRIAKLDNLGALYMRQFSRVGGLSVINKAIDYRCQAVLLASSDHKNAPARLIELGDSHLCRFQYSGQPEDLNKLLDCHSRALLLTPRDHMTFQDRLKGLGDSYTCRYKNLGRLSDLDASIECESQVELLTITGCVDRPSQLGDFGHTFASQFLPSHPGTQLQCARRWAKCFSLLGISPDFAYQSTMERLLPLVWLETTIDHDQRQNLLVEFGDFVMEAVSSAISSKNYDHALEWLEETRSITWRQILQLKTPFDELSAVDHVLGGQLREIGHDLIHLGVQTDNCEQDARRHYSLASKWEKHLVQARNLPGFHNFMRPRKANELMAAAKDGPIAVISAHWSHCDALIIRPNSNDIAHVPLENLTQKKAFNIHARLTSLIGNAADRSGGLKNSKHMSKPGNYESFKHLLAVLWEDVVHPVLQFLGYTRKLPIDKLPHITWCATGPLAFLPLHAAGSYDGEQPNAPDLVISSYTPTLSALLAGNAQVANSHTRILAVGQERTVGFDDLPHTVRELAMIKEHAKTTGYLQLDGDAATVDAVLEAMEECNWVHLACHATERAGQLTRSAFALRDGSLELGAITKRSFKSKGLAFLSASQTATRDKRLLDEAVHLAAGMQMSGYPSVIASMWAIEDEDAPEIARLVYADLLKDGRMDHTKASTALHKAVANLRTKVGEEALERWVPFIHVGI